MDWNAPYILLLILPLLGLLFLFDARTTHPMSMGRRRALLMVRSLMVACVLIALASPAWIVKSNRQAVVFVLDHSRSQGAEGIREVYAKAEQLRSQIPGDVEIGYVAVGSQGEVLRAPSTKEFELSPDPELMERLGSQSNLSSAVTLTQGLFPAGVARHVVYVGDGQETRGDLKAISREAAIADVSFHAAPVGGEKRPDVRVTEVRSSQSRLNEGASLEISVFVESSIAGKGVIKLYENGLKVGEDRPIELKVGQDVKEVFVRAPDQAKIYRYRAVVEGFEADSIPENNEAMAVVDVRGKPLILYVEGESGQEHLLIDAMAKEGIRLHYRQPESMPQTLSEMAGYDAVILSDVAAHKVGEAGMAAIRDYVGELGGGFVMVGGMNSFGVGGYYRTPIEEVLPVKLKAPDQEVQQSSALALVIDRSGSMSGQKIELCKSAAIATAEILTKKDFITVVAFDSKAHIIVPMTRASSKGTIASQIAALSSGGGTNIYPGMANAQAALGKVKARIKHMIVLTDGQTSGSGYEALAAQCHAEGITISTVAVGGGAQVALLQAIAAAGGGQSYQTADPASITRIFTQDTMVHTGRMIREEAFNPKQVESHPMLKNWTEFSSPPLLGYVKTNRKATSQVPLVTDLDDPLLAHWRYGLGKVTAFTSDCKSRWASLWINQWGGYSQLWAQILRETARQPQGQNMDINLESVGEETICTVDLMEDAGTRKNDAVVEADIYYLPANALGSNMKLIATKEFTQRASGKYVGSFRPDDPGVYLVRAREGSKMVSAGYVHNPSSEVATGRINEPLLKKACALTGGTYLGTADAQLNLTGADVSRFVELWPYVIVLLVLLLMVDVAIRRWEHLRGLIDQIKGVFAAAKA